MTASSPAAVSQFLDYLATGPYPNRGNAEFFLSHLFAGQQLSGARVLDVGGGNGLLSFWAALHGAREVICLEPEAAGATLGIQDHFTTMAEDLALPAARLERATLQDYLASDAAGTFDLVLMHNVINHLDEPACMRLHHDPQAASVYRELFRQLAAHMAPGAGLMIADCARSNMWPAMGIRNPFMPTIEWTKHQNPDVWARVLADAGFRMQTTRWTSFNTLGPAGRVLLGHRWGAWLTLGHFIAWFGRD